MPYTRSARPAESAGASTAPVPPARLPGDQCPRTAGKGWRVMKAMLMVALWLALWLSGARPPAPVTAQPCPECGTAALVVNGEVWSATGVRRSPAAPAEAYAPVALLAQALNGTTADLGPHLRLDGTALYDPA